MSLPSRLSRIAQNFFSQLIADEDTEDEGPNDDVDLYARDLPVEYDTSVDICSAVVSVPREKNTTETVEEDNDDDSSDHPSDGCCSDLDSNSDSAPKADSSVIKEDDIPSTSQVNNNEANSEQEASTHTPLSPEKPIDDSDMSGISDVESPPLNTEDMESNAPLADIINGIVQQRRQEAKRDALKRRKKHRGFKVSKPHPKQERNTKALEAIEQQLQPK